METARRPRSKPPRRSDVIARQIEALIRTGELEIGGRVPSERALSERFNASRATIREALFSLRKVGLISVRDGSPSRVVQPTPDDLLKNLSSVAHLLLSQPHGMKHFQGLRILFESGVAREAAQVVTPARIAPLAEALAANEAAIGHQARFERTDFDFHLALAQACANPIYPALHGAFRAWLADQRTISARGGASQQEVYAQHAAIFEAVAAGDAAAAQDAMERHLHGVIRNYWQA